MPLQTRVVGACLHCRPDLAASSRKDALGILALGGKGVFLLPSAESPEALGARGGLLRVSLDPAETCKSMIALVAAKAPREKLRQSARFEVTLTPKEMRLINRRGSDQIEIWRERHGAALPMGQAGGIGIATFALRGGMATWGSIRST